MKPVQNITCFVDASNLCDVTCQVASDENGYLRRRLEAIERTTLKLNLGGASDDLQVLRERLALESKEVLRLRKTADDLQIDKLAMSEVGIWWAERGVGGGGLEGLTLVQLGAVSIADFITCEVSRQL